MVLHKFSALSANALDGAFLRGSRQRPLRAICRRARCQGGAPLVNTLQSCPTFCRPRCSQAGLPWLLLARPVFVVSAADLALKVL